VPLEFLPGWLRLERLQYDFVARLYIQRVPEIDQYCAAFHFGMRTLRFSLRPSGPSSPRPMKHNRTAAEVDPLIAVAGGGVALHNSMGGCLDRGLRHE